MRFPTQTEEQALHERVLSGDPVAPADVFRAFMDPILGVLVRRTSLQREDAYDSVIDVLVSYLRNPERYIARKGRLHNYLIQAAKKRMTDRRRSSEARERREQEFGGAFELWSRSPKETLEVSVEAHLALGRLEKFPLPHEDRVLLRLYLQGEGSTRVVGEAIGLASLPEKERQREVKRHRDRLMKVLARAGKEGSDVES